MTGPQGPPSWVPLHFPVFCKSCRPLPFLGSPILPFMLFPCYPPGGQAGATEAGCWTSNQLYSMGLNELTLEPLEASGMPVPALLVSHLGWGSQHPDWKCAH